MTPAPAALPGGLDVVVEGVVRTIAGYWARHRRTAMPADVNEPEVGGMGSVRSELGGPMFSVIVVGTDGSETAAKAVEVAADMAAVHGSRLHIVTAYQAVLPALSHEEKEALGELAWMASPGERAERLVNEAAEHAAAAGVDVETHVDVGDPAHALIEVAEAEGADLIVVGNKGLHSPARFLLGSVPSKIVHHAPCHVLVVRTT